jgi:sec-independent protein translocase protein TatA
MLSAPHLAIVLVIVLVIFGPGKLPDLGEALGKGIRNFKKATEGDEAHAPAVEVEQIEHKSSSIEEPVQRD